MNFAEVKARHKKSDFHMGAAKRNQETVYPFKNYGEQAHQDRGWLIEQLEVLPCYFQWFSDSAPDCKQEHGNYVQKYCPACKPKGVDVHTMLGRKAEP